MPTERANDRLITVHAPFPGGVGIFGFADLANFWPVFSVFALKNFGFSVLVSCAVCWFRPFSLWFLVFVNNHGGFSDSCPIHFTVFLVLPRKLQLAVMLKLNSKGPLTVRGMHDKPRV